MYTFVIGIGIESTILGAERGFDSPEDILQIMSQYGDSLLALFAGGVAMFSVQRVLNNKGEAMHLKTRKTQSDEFAETGTGVELMHVTAAKQTKRNQQRRARLGLFHTATNTRDYSMLYPC